MFGNKSRWKVRRVISWGRFSFIFNILSNDYSILKNKNKSNVVILVDIELEFNE